VIKKSYREWDARYLIEEEQKSYDELEKRLGFYRMG
jgi:hypothetical protein